MTKQETLTKEELMNVARLFCSSQIENQELGVQLAETFGFDEQELIICILDDWQGWKRIKTRPIEVSYEKVILDKKVQFKYNLENCSVFWSFAEYRHLERRIFLNSPHEWTRGKSAYIFEQLILNFIQQARKDFQR